MRFAALFALTLAATACNNWSEDNMHTHSGRVMVERSEPALRPNANAPAVGGGGVPMGRYPHAPGVQPPTTGHPGQAGAGSANTTSRVSANTWNAKHSMGIQGGIGGNADQSASPRLPMPDTDLDDASHD